MGTYIPKNNKGPDGLTETQRRFCEEYVIDYNATEAYLRASATCTNRTSAGIMGARLLKRKDIIANIHEIQKALFEAKCITAERIADELSKIAFDPDTSKKDRMQAMALLQKQMGLDQQVIKADVNQTTVIKIGIDEDE